MILIYILKSVEFGIRKNKWIIICLLILFVSIFGGWKVVYNKQFLADYPFLLSFIQFEDNSYIIDDKNDNLVKSIGIIDGPVDTKHVDLQENEVIQKYFVDSTNFDDQKHGTSIAGLISASDNHFGIKGIVDNLRIINAVVLKNSVADQQDIARAIQYCLLEGVDAINISIELYRFDEVLLNAISLAEKKNVKIFFANGNGGWRKNIENIEKPNFKNIVFVGMLNSNGEVAKTNMNNRIPDQYELGDKLLSTDLNNGYAIYSGTSYSSAIACAKYVLN